MIDFALWLLEVKDFVFLVEQTILYNKGPRCLAWLLKWLVLIYDINFVAVLKSTEGN